ncbi:hypothetical protein C4559_05325 [Candidatus Microgenomates bacterium]|nr:MAG: hypothetical protein C4559_05325 [Candidatus Microgenomates bacterium]
MSSKSERYCVRRKAFCRFQANKRNDFASRTEAKRVELGTHWALDSGKRGKNYSMEVLTADIGLRTRYQYERCIELAKTGNMPSEWKNFAANRGLLPSSTNIFPLPSLLDANTRKELVIFASSKKEIPESVEIKLPADIVFILQ